MKLSRKKLVEILRESGLTPKIDCLGHVTCETNNLYILVFCIGKRPKPSHISLFTTIHCNGQSRLTLALFFAKKIKQLIGIPILWHAAQRKVHGII
jgi:hypothetical protein